MMVYELKGCQVLVTVAVLAVLQLAFSPRKAAGQLDPPPNVLVILADDLGFGDLACYGAADMQTPHLDRLAKQGMRFENFYANCCVCSPTRAALLTGRYPELSGVPGVIRTHPENNWGYLAPQVAMLPDVLRRVQYHTALVGKWHLGLESPNLPNERGFDEFHGFLGDMMDDYFHHRRHDINYLRHNSQTIDPQGHATDLFTEWACRILRERRDKTEPFFLYLAYNAPHTPIQPTAASLQRVRARESDLSDDRARLVALIEHMDESIGKVLSVLDEIGKANDTLVVFTSDNGGQISIGANNGPWRDGKQSMYEGGLRVPMIARWPGHIAAGSTSPAVAATMDLFPTICEVAGATVHLPDDLDGRSLLAVLQGEAEQPRGEPIFFQRREGGPTYNGLCIHAVREGRWKLVHNSPFAPLELYDLENDPGERRNLAATNPQQLRHLADQLQRHLQRGGAVPWQAPRR